eukprot:TRINITY_DN44036_c0_g1_i1.p1 TRINITY_DN44036_c0_g1~~TRINITY_DN44036_c0_g1_i1.p1  ORF type:complete len:363 (-),score=33.54 TRINITY_DN44036_c0_g1_i1:306-1394(-)
MAGGVQSATAVQRQSSCAWDMSPAPLLFVGFDGQVHETRPTTSLAHDLAASDANEELQLKAQSLAKKSSGALERPALGIGARQAGEKLSEARSTGTGGYPSRRASLADRPIGGFAGGGFSNGPQSPLVGRSTCAFAGSSSSGGPRSPLADRPAGSFGSSRSSSGPRPQPFHSERRKSGASGNRSPAPAPGRQSIARSPHSPPSAHSPSPSSASRAPPASHSPSPSTASIRLRRSSLRPFEPINALLDLGMDRDSARAAIAAAGGDVDKAVRLVMDDCRAHDAREGSEWEFQGDRGWVPFDEDSESVLRAALDAGQSAFELYAGGQHYLIDLEHLSQLNLTTSRSRAIRRRRNSGTIATSSHR